MAGVEVFGWCSICGADAFKPTDTCWSCGKHAVQLYLTPESEPTPILIDAATSGPRPTPEVRHAAHYYAGAGPLAAIGLEILAVLLFWPGLISDTVTYSAVPHDQGLYAAIALSIVLAGSACGALYLAVRARRGDKLGKAAVLALFATLALVLSVVIGYGPSDDIANACGAWFHGQLGAPTWAGGEPCPGGSDTFGLTLVAGGMWLLATLTAVLTTLGYIVRFAR